ncbi:MAG: hypothetical protein HUJ51_05705 [Eggerthellaceae bacterium]|nr:hypothetical protein [Eggerthellaceae bacterium]
MQNKLPWLDVTMCFKAVVQDPIKLHQLLKSTKFSIAITEGFPPPNLLEGYERIFKVLSSKKIHWK